jgi:uncharacterized protein YndB with AHSA1/START domain
MSAKTSDRIEKEIVIKAPRARVWSALTDAAEFGKWFGVNLEGPFVAGKPVRGRITTKGYDHLVMQVVVEKIVPQELFSYRWHPNAVDPNADYSKEPSTLVEFRLAEGPEGTTLTVVESGFDEIPAARRDEAFRMNSAGWAIQVENVKRHVEG